MLVLSEERGKYTAVYSFAQLPPLESLGTFSCFPSNLIPRSDLTGMLNLTDGSVFGEDVDADILGIFALSLLLC